MEISMRDLWTVIHGMGFGALFMLAFSGAIMELYGGWAAQPQATIDQGGQTRLRVYLVVMVLLAWLTVFSGAYIVYPWYRAIPPAGMTDLTGFPQKLLISSPTTSEWHAFGMEWKEHVAWIAPIAMTMVAYVYWKYGRGVNKHRELRKAALIFALAAFVATAVAGGFGAFLNKYAPIRGGATIHLMNGE
ncbi:hypothetical protein [Rhodoferax sp. UBA5149]|uniref:hypothetical protein n=1 Tax=Rhodoferax sp. UBA5149 TaxID=1947379 RepID=UPI0025EE3B4B|nr:hypothetical protein [Rhodoferax sp. UBA5149]